MRGGWGALLVLGVMLAGCSTPAKPHAAPALSFPVMDVQTTPTEAFEARGVIRLAWSGGLFGVYTTEDGMPNYVVVKGSDLYASETLMGWTRWDLQAYVDQSSRGYRYEAWDIPTLLTSAPGAVVSADTFQADPHVVVAGKDHVVHLSVHHAAEAATQVHAETDLDAESPYTFLPATQPMPFAVAIPSVTRTRDEVQTLDAKAREGHAHILTWIDQYKAQTGRLPDEPSADSLALQRLSQPWPTNPYDGSAMADRQASGHFLWRRCSDTDASFHGFGWDGAPLNQDYGRGCAD